LDIRNESFSKFPIAKVSRWNLLIFPIGGLKGIPFIMVRPTFTPLSPFLLRPFLENFGGNLSYISQFSQPYSWAPFPRAMCRPGRNWGKFEPLGLFTSYFGILAPGFWWGLYKVTRGALI